MGNTLFLEEKNTFQADNSEIFKSNINKIWRIYIFLFFSMFKSEPKQIVYSTDRDNSFRKFNNLDLSKLGF